jgi:mannose-1-phosphate guanylyltransferase
MKAYLLAGGLGTRLRPYTDHTPKCLVDIIGTPLLAVWLDLCARHGIDQVLINVFRHADAVRRFLATADSAVAVTLVEEHAALGSATTVRANRGFVAGEESFFVLYADNLTNTDLGRMRDFHATHQAMLTLGLFRAPRPEQAGVVTLGAGGVVTSFEEKPARPRSNLANAGVYLCRQPVFDAIPVRPGVVDFARDVLPHLTGRMYGFEIGEYLADVGTAEGLAAARAAWPMHRRGGGEAEDR